MDYRGFETSAYRLLCAAGLDLCVCVAVALLLACHSTCSTEIYGDGGDPSGHNSCDAARFGRCQRQFCPALSNPAPQRGAAAQAQSFSQANSGNSGRFNHHTAAGSMMTDLQSSTDGTAHEASAAEAVSTELKGQIGAVQNAENGAGPLVPVITKSDVRQGLAFVSGHYPSTRPTRGSLKQVFNFFQQQRLLQGLQSPACAREHII